MQKESHKCTVLKLFLGTLKYKVKIINHTSIQAFNCCASVICFSTLGGNVVHLGDP